VGKVIGSQPVTGHNTPFKKAPAQEHREGEFRLRDRRRSADAAAPEGDAFVSDFWFQMFQIFFALENAVLI